MKGQATYLFESHETDLFQQFLAFHYVHHVLISLLSRFLVFGVTSFCRSENSKIEFWLELLEPQKNRHIWRLLYGRIAFAILRGLQTIGSAPPAGWVQPVNNNTWSGRYVWSRYASWYSGANLYNYAVAGAVCSNDITPRWDDDVVGLFPDVQGYEIPAFLADKAVTNADGSKFFTGEPDYTVYSLWIGTNDLGNKAFLTDSEIKGKTIPDYIDCIYSVFDSLYVHLERGISFS